MKNLYHMASAASNQAKFIYNIENSNEEQKHPVLDKGIAESNDTPAGSQFDNMYSNLTTKFWNTAEKNGYDIDDNGNLNTETMKVVDGIHIVEIDGEKISLSTEGMVIDGVNIVREASSIRINGEETRKNSSEKLAPLLDKASALIAKAEKKPLDDAANDIAAM